VVITRSTLCVAQDGVWRRACDNTRNVGQFSLEVFASAMRACPSFGDNQKHRIEPAKSQKCSARRSLDDSYWQLKSAIFWTIRPRYPDRACGVVHNDLHLTHILEMYRKCPRCGHCSSAVAIRRPTFGKLWGQLFASNPRRRWGVKQS